MLRLIVLLVSLGARAIRAMCRRRADLVLENLALQQQLVVLKRHRPRPTLDDTDRAFWVALRDAGIGSDSVRGQTTLAARILNKGAGVRSHQPEPSAALHMLSIISSGRSEDGLCDRWPVRTNSALIMVRDSLAGFDEAVGRAATGGKMVADAARKSRKPYGPRRYQPKSSNRIFSGSTPRPSSICMQALSMSGGPQR